jgi:hypothetical protein
MRTKDSALPERCAASKENVFLIMLLLFICWILDTGCRILANHEVELSIRVFQLAIFCTISRLIIGSENYEWIPAYGVSQNNRVIEV